MAIHKQKKAITLIELLVAVFLLGTVVLTAVTIELAVRRMQTKPSAQVKILDELIPVVDRIRKDFERQIGTLANSSLSVEESGRRLVIRVDSDNSGNISAADQWRAYRWPGTAGDPIEYYTNNTTITEIIADGITNFSVTEAYNKTAISVRIGTRKDPSQAENLLTNPAANLTTTIFSRMTTGG